MRFKDFYQIIVILCVTSTYNASEFILDPPVAKVGRTQALIFIPGAQVPAQNYFDLLRKIQANLSFPLIVVALDFIGGTPQPIGLKQRIAKLIKRLGSNQKEELGPEDIWIGGHSLGGIVARRVAQDFAGLILLGAYFDRINNRSETQILDYGKPILILSGLQDGITRVPYVARDYSYDTLGHQSGDWSRTMILLDGVNHSYYAGNELLRGDIQGDLEPEAARTLTAKAMAGFLSQFSTSLTHLQQNLEASELAKLKKTSDRLASPYLEATRLDRSICEVAQQEILSQESSELKIRVGTNTKTNIAQFAAAKPRMVQVEDDRVEIEVIQYDLMQPNLVDRANLPLAPKAIACKMKSAESVSDLLWLQRRESAPTSCVDLQYNLQRKVLDLLSKEQAQRYKTSTGFLGYPIEKRHTTGIGWLSNRSSLIDKKGEGYRPGVQALYTDLQAPFGLDGMIYCKFLSPARLLEWYTIDSLLEATN